MTIRIGSKVKVKGLNIRGKVTHIRHTSESDAQYAYEKKHGMTPRYKVDGKYWSRKKLIHQK